MSKFKRDQVRRPVGSDAERRTFRPWLTVLEDRTNPVAITLTGTTANVDVNAPSGEVVTFSTNAADVITVSSSIGVVTVNGVLQSGPANLTGIRVVLVNDSTLGNGVDFGLSTATYAATFTVTLDDSPQAVNFVGGSAFGANNLTVTTTSHILIDGALTSTSGNIILSANMQAPPTVGLFAGIELIEATLSSTTGTVTLRGRGGDAPGGNNYGVYLHPGDSATSVIGSTVIITGVGGASTGLSNNGVFITGGASVSSTGNGSVVVTGTGGGTGTSTDNIGVLVSAGGVITAGGVGSVVVTGNGGAGTIGSDVGVFVVDAGSQITSGGGTVDVTGRGGGSGVDSDGVAVKDGGEITSGGGAVNITGFGGVGSFGVNVTTTGSQATGGIVSSGGTAPLTITADSINFNAAVIRAGAAGTATATLQPVSAGTLVNLGGSDVFAGSPPTLGLTDAELDQVAAGTLVLGRSNAGALTVTAPLTRPAATAMQLMSGGNIAFTGGGVNTGGGPLAVSPNTGFTPAVAGTDATASTVSFAGGSVLSLLVNGTTPDTLFTRLVASGVVDLTGSGLTLSGTYTPLPGDTFTIVSGASITGTLTGLPNGATFTFNGVALSVIYTPTAVLLRVNRPPTGVSAGGPYTIPERSGLTVSAPPATDPDGDPLTYTWDVNGDGTFGDEAFGTVSNGGQTVDFTAAGMAALGLANGPQTITTLAVRVSDGFANVTATGTLTITTTAHPLVVSNAGQVRVFNPNGSTRDLEPFPGFLGDVRVASADLNGDGVQEIVVAAGQGGGPHVKVYDGASGNEIASFYAYAPTFTGGVFVAATAGRIITGAGFGGGPHVKVIDATKLGQLQPDGQIADSALIASFYAYDPNFSGGVRVATGDVTGDGVDDIVTGAGPGGGPHVKTFDGRTFAEVGSFFAFAPDFGNGVYVAATAGRIAVGAGAWGGPHVRVFDIGGNVQNEFFAYPSDFVGGVRVAFIDVDSDGVDEVVTAPGLGGGLVKAFSQNNPTNVTLFTTFDPLDPLGVFVG